MEFRRLLFRSRVRQGRPERAGGRGPAVAADRWADGWRHAGVRAGIGNWGLGIGTSGFAPALRFHESLIPNSQSRLLREHLAQEPEQLAERMRRLVALATVERVAPQRAQLLWWEEHTSELQSPKRNQ